MEGHADIGGGAGGAGSGGAGVGADAIGWAGLPADFIAFFAAAFASSLAWKSSFFCLFLLNLLVSAPVEGHAMQLIT